MRSAGLRVFPDTEVEAVRRVRLGTVLISKDGTDTVILPRRWHHRPRMTIICMAI